MLEQSFERLYLQFRSGYLWRLFNTRAAENEGLSAAEFFCAEAVYLLGAPNVSEFASFIGVSLPNANYKLNSLIKKGYVEKRADEGDKRAFHLSATPKFSEGYGVNSHETRFALSRIRECFSPSELDLLDAMIRRISGFVEQAIEEVKEAKEENEHGN